MPARDITPIAYYDGGGWDDFPFEPIWGSTLGGNYVESRNKLMALWRRTVSNRHLLACPFGNKPGGLGSFPFSPPYSVDVQPHLRQAICDSLRELKTVRPGCLMHLNVGFAVQDASHHKPTRIMGKQDKGWVQEAIGDWKQMGFNGAFAFDASSWPGDPATGNPGFDELSEEVSAWIAPAEMMLEAVPFAGGVIDGARLVKHPAMAIDNNQWVRDLPKSTIKAPLSYNGQPCREAMVIFYFLPADATTKALMEVCRQRGFGIGGSPKHDALVAEVMQKYPTTVH